MKTITISEETYESLKSDIDRLEDKSKGILTKVATTKIEGTEKYLVADCFQGKNISYRDSDFDNYLPKDMPTTGGGEFSVFKWEKPICFKEMVQAFLDTKEENLDTLTKLLIAGGHTFSLKQIEDLLKQVDSGKNLGLVTDGWSNLFPIHDKNGVLFFADVNLGVDARRWYAFVDRFDYDDVWVAERRVSFRN